MFAKKQSNTIKNKQQQKLAFYNACIQNICAKFLEIMQ